MKKYSGSPQPWGYTYGDSADLAWLGLSNPTSGEGRDQGWEKIIPGQQGRWWG